MEGRFGRSTRTTSVSTRKANDVFLFTKRRKNWNERISTRSFHVSIGTQVRMEDGHLIAETTVEVPMSSESLYEILVDYENAHHVYRNIHDTIVTWDVDGNKQVLQTCSWEFMVFRGTFDTLFDVREDPIDLVVEFTSKSSGFMGRLDVRWTLEKMDVHRTKAKYVLMVQPNVLPPRSLRKQTDKIFKRQVEHLLEDLSVEVERRLKADVPINS